RVAGALVREHALGVDLGPDLRDRIARVDPLRAALVTEVAPGAVPHTVRAVVELEPALAVAVADVADELRPLGERRRPQELGVGLHRVALRDAAAALDAERLLHDP